MTAYVFIQPLDVLFLRGNRLFGDPGSYGESLIPPWPSAIAGALRSHILAKDGCDLMAFAAGGVAHPELGTPEQPGPFGITGFQLARLGTDGPHALHALPADLILTRHEDGTLAIQTLKPTAPGAGIESSSALDRLPVLAARTRAKPAAGYWLTDDGWRDYLMGKPPAPEQVVDAAQLWRLDPRVGVGLDPIRRRAEDGKLFTAQAVAFTPEMGFLAGVTGVHDLQAGVLRLGGDGRAARLTLTPYQPPVADYPAIAAGRRARLVLTTPGLFAGGWRLPGVDAAGHFQLGPVRGRLVCAAVPRYEVISGWDQARHRPKPACRMAPAGSVYWLEDLQAGAADLDNLAAAGLWRDPGENAQRRAEGFNRFTFAVY